MSFSTKDKLSIQSNSPVSMATLKKISLISKWSTTNYVSDQRVPEIAFRSQSEVPLADSKLMNITHLPFTGLACPLLIDDPVACLDSECCGVCDDSESSNCLEGDQEGPLFGAECSSYQYTFIEPYDYEYVLNQSLSSHTITEVPTRR